MYSKVKQMIMVDGMSQIMAAMAIFPEELIKRRQECELHEKEPRIALILRPVLKSRTHFNVE